MATITPTQTIRPLAATDSPQNTRGLWEFAVPIDHDENSATSESRTYSSNDSNQPAASRQPISQQKNGVANVKASENDFLTPAKINSLRKKTSDLSNASDPDSLLDLYKPPSNTRSASYGSGSKPARKGGAQSNSASKPPEEDESNWIHRDKLAQIESRELEEAGLRVGRRISEQPNKRDEKRQRLASPVRMEGEPEEYDNQNQNQDGSLSTPPKSFLPKPNSTRGVNSRIPVPRSVPGANPNSDAPGVGTRSRNGSLGYSPSVEHSPQSQPSRQASHDEAEDIGLASPPDTPPRKNGSSLSVDKQSSPQKKNGAKTSRKPSAPRTASAQKQRTAAVPLARQNTDSKRPGTSSGTPRPSTSHRLEGDPPWISTMYKPDPRLPPDQQMLPTHAKRLAQEQWEKEGKTGTVYDREFRLLNAEAFPEKPPSPEVKAEPSQERKLDSGQLSPPLQEDQIKTTVLSPKWSFGQITPLGSPRSPASRPGTSDTHGGYKTMPTINMPSSSPRVQSPAPKAAPIRLMDMPDDEDEKGKKGGCAGCGCVIM